MRPRYVGKAYPTVNNIGITRLGLKVANALATYERLTSAGLEFVGEPVELSVGDGIRTCCFYNAERAVLQLVETGDHGAGEFDRIFSVCISVTDLDRSLPFYRDVLGFNVVTQFEAETNGLFPVGEGDSAKVRGAWLRPGSDERNTLVELVEWVDPKTTGAPYETVYNLGFPRVAFYVTDIQAEYDRLREHVTFFSPPVITDLSGAKAGYNCFRDPDGTILQLYEDIPA
jgi:catechol 2,3-dioxygenase-like lactoylglutathione lyase family enzyme